MAEDKKLVEAITSMDVDFAQWYTDVCKKAELMSYSSVKGCMIFKPAGYAIWENIKNEMDRRFKETGVENVYLPMFIPESLLEKEKDHVEGFAPEVAWVTYGGLNPLQERMCVRPTSETLFCDFYKDEIQSYRDLPKVYNQWWLKDICTVFVGLFFTGMYGGNGVDMLFTGIVGVFLAIWLHAAGSMKLNSLIKDLTASIVLSVVARVLIHLNPLAHLDLIIIGSIMVLVPGAAITNAIRDTLHGDYASGNANILQAFTEAALIAMGVYIGLVIIS